MQREDHQQGRGIDIDDDIDDEGRYPIHSCTTSESEDNVESSDNGSDEDKSISDDSVDESDNDMESDDNQEENIGKYAVKEHKGSNKQHSPLLPRDIRAIIVGKSGAGKSVFLTYLLLEPEMLDYDNLIVCGNSLHQPEYKIMNAAFAKKLSKKQIKALFEHQEEAMEEGGPDTVIENMRDDMCKGDINAVSFILTLLEYIILLPTILHRRIY